MKRLTVLALVGLACVARPLWAEVTLPAVIGSHMVLQQGQVIPVWGWDDPETEVTVTFAGQSVSGKTDAQGKWQVHLAALTAGGPHQMVIQGTNQVTLGGVLVGEVWLCSGQSNMEWTVRQSLNPEKEIAAGTHPRIRHIKIPHRPQRHRQRMFLPAGGKNVRPRRWVPLPPWDITLLDIYRANWMYQWA